MRKIIDTLIHLIFLSLFPIFMIGADIELDKIISDANKTHKSVMLFLHKDGCSFCEKMLFDLEEKNISTKLEKNFILVDINRDDDETLSFQDYTGINREFLKKLGVNLYPTIAFIDEHGLFIYSTVGYRNPKKLETILDYISSKTYTKMTFEEFEDESLNP